MGLTLYQPYSYAVVHFGDLPAERIAGVVGQDQAILYERPSEVTPYASAIQADFRASGEAEKARSQRELCEFRFAITEQ